MTSDDLVALVDGTLHVASAWATGRVKIDAGVRDLLQAALGLLSAAASRLSLTARVEAELSGQLRRGSFLMRQARRPSTGARAGPAPAAQSATAAESTARRPCRRPRARRVHRLARPGVRDARSGQRRRRSPSARRTATVPAPSRALPRRGWDARSAGRRGRAPDRSGAVAAGAASSSAGVVTPVNTSRLAQPAAFAPSMSVSRRSPTTIGRWRSGSLHRLAVHRRVRLAGRRPASTAGRVPQRGDQRPVAGQRSARRRDRRVEVRRHPRHAPVDRDGALGELAPVEVGRVTLHDGSEPRRRVAPGRRPRSRSASIEPDRADHQHPGTGRQPIGQVMRRGLGGGDHLAGLGRDAELGQVVGDRVRAGGRRCW